MAFANQLQINWSYYKYLLTPLLSVRSHLFNVKQKRIVWSISSYWSCSFAFFMVHMFKINHFEKVRSINDLKGNMHLSSPTVFLLVNPYYVHFLCSTFNFTGNITDSKIWALIVNAMKFDLQWRHVESMIKLHFYCL